MKKITALLLCMAFLLSAVACGSNDEVVETPAPEITTTPTEEPAPTLAPEDMLPAEPGEPEDMPAVMPELPAEPNEDEPAVEEPAPPVEEPLPPVEEPVVTPAPQAPAAPSGNIGEMSLQEIIDQLVAMTNLESAPYFTTYPVSAEDAPYVIGYEAFSGVFSDALGYGPMMGSNPFVMVLFSLPADVDAAAFAADIESNADLRKWICVEAEVADTAVYGNLVLFIMSDTASANAFIGAFNQLAG